MVEPPLLTSTAESHLTCHVVQSIVVKDAYTLLFVLSAAATTGAATAKHPTTTTAASKAALDYQDEGNGRTTSLYGGVFSSLNVPHAASTDVQRRQGTSPAENERGRPTIKDCLWALAAAQGDVAAPCLCCERNSVDASAAQQQGDATCSSMTREASDSCASATSSLAELRATEYFAATKAVAGPSSSPAMRCADSADVAALKFAPAVVGSHLCYLHIVREDDRGGAVEVWCMFDCGCGALATFALEATGTAAPGEWRRVNLQQCVWVPRVTRRAKATRDGLVTSAAQNGNESERPCALMTAAAAPAAAAAVAVATTTALVRPLCSTADADSEGEEEMLLLTPYQFTEFTGAAETRLHFVCLRRARIAEETGTRNGSAPTAALRKSGRVSLRSGQWKPHAQGWFRMQDVFRIPPGTTTRAGSSQRAETAVDRGNTASDFGVDTHTRHHRSHSCASLRHIRWLPGTLDATHRFPLVALLYAVPAVSAGDPCLDTLSVCCLAEEEEAVDMEDGADASSTARKAAAVHDVALRGRVVSGHVRVGPWSVRGVTLAHPSFLFSATLAPPPQAAGSALVQGVRASSAGAEARQRKLALGSATAAFHRAREAARCAPTELLGVFQRPAQVPYAASRLLRAAAAIADAAQQSSEAMDCRSVEMSSLNQRSFGFVLYGAAGVLARCPVDGYVECAETVTCEGAPGNGSEGPAAEVATQTVAQICALVSGLPSASVQGGSRAVAVVLTILALPMRGAAGIGQGSWRLSVQLSRRVEVRPPSQRPSASPPLSPLVSVDRMLCWTGGPAQASTQNSDIARNSNNNNNNSTCLRVIVSGYAALVEGSVEVLHQGVFVLSSVPSRSTEETTDKNAASEAPTPALLSASVAAAAAAAAVNSGGAFIVRRVSALELARALDQCSRADTTREDVLSHTPSGVVVAVPHGSSSLASFTALPSDMLPVALAWVRKPSAKSLVAAGSCGPAVSEREARLLEMDVVAVLRCGDIIGWRCSADTPAATEHGSGDNGRSSASSQVLHFCALRSPMVSALATTSCAAAASVCASSSPSSSSSAAHLADEFLQALLVTGAGPAEVHMEVVGVESKSIGGAATGTVVLLVVAVGSFVGVVNLCDGHVEHVLDMRLAAAATTVTASGDGSEALFLPSDCATSRLSVAQFERLPTVTPYSVAPCGDGGSESVGQAYSFAWTGLLASRTGDNEEDVARSCSPGTAAGAKDASVLMHKSERTKIGVVACVAQLGVVTWSDLAASRVCAASADSAALRKVMQRSAKALPSDAEERGKAQTPTFSHSRVSLPADFTPPPPIVFLSVSAGWAEAATARALCPFVGWADFVRLRGDADLSPAQEAAPKLAACDAALLRALWPGKRPCSENVDGFEINALDGQSPRVVHGGGKGDVSSSGEEHPRVVPLFRCLYWRCSPSEATPQVQDRNSANPTADPTAVHADALVQRLLGQSVRACLAVSPYNVTGVGVRVAHRLALYSSARSVAAAQQDMSDGNRGSSSSSLADLPRCALQRVLYITSLTAPATTPASSPSTDPLLLSTSSASLPQPLLSSVLCTVAMCTERTAASPVASTAARPPLPTSSSSMMSFLLCMVPLTRNAPHTTPSISSSALAASLGITTSRPANPADASLGSFAWHWIPLPAVSVAMSGTTDTCSADVGVTRVLPISPPSQPGVWEFYCEGVAAATMATSAPLHVQAQLIIHVGLLRAALDSAASIDSDRGFPSGEAGSVFAYSAVDPTLVHWKDAVARPY
ncbi:hypothetical protein N2W54_006665 [Lotmaria passim]